VADVVNALSNPERLVSFCADIDRALLLAEDGRDTMSALTQLAVAAVPGVEQASISERRSGEFRTVSSTGDIATAGDLIQYQIRTGPCVDALVEDTVLCSNDIARDTRWPDFGTRVHAETGTASMMSLRLFMEENNDRVAGLNLYSTHRDAFDGDAQMIAAVLATHSRTALIVASARDRVANLQRALTTNRRIGMAMGVLMSSHKVTADDAFILLRIASQNSNRKLAEIADDVVATGTLELPAPRSATEHRPKPGGPRDTTHANGKPVTPT
jgi:hypothetical protein